MPDNDNFVSLRQYAALKKVSIPKVYALIEAGEIEIQLVAGRKVIDWERFKDYDTSSRRNKTSLLEIVTGLQKEVKEMKKVLYQKNLVASKK